MDENQPRTMFPGLKRSSHKTGILPYQRIKTLIEAGYVRASEPVSDDQIQPASLDLRLGRTAFQVRASFLPGAASDVEDYLPALVLDELSLVSGCTLEAGRVYLVPLMEELNLPTVAAGGQHGSPLSAKANPKSTTGRLDVLVRLITDRGAEFDLVPPAYKGRLYAEVAPRSFSVTVRAGSRLNQLRFRRGSPRPAEKMLRDLEEEQRLVYSEDGMPAKAEINNGLWISVDLRGGEDGVIGYRALRNAARVDIDQIARYDPRKFWEPVLIPERGEIVLEPGAFHILRSQERIGVPPWVAAEMVNYEPAMGEFRVHYAGFFDPGFGYGDGDAERTRAVLEVRSHDVPFLLRDGQRVGRLIYERLLERSDKTYGAGAGSSYQHQTIGLGKQFKTTEPRARRSRAAG